MMNLSTNYMGLHLKNPLMISSSRLTGDIKSIRQCVEAGASAIVLKSLFEEQIKLDLQRVAFEWQEPEDKEQDV